MQRLLAVFVLALAGNAWSQVLFSDSFDGAILDSSKWDVILPNANSQVFLQNGFLKSINMGTIVSKQKFNFPYTLSATFMMPTGHDLTNITIRSDGVIDSRDPWRRVNGLNFEIWASPWPAGNIFVERVPDDILAGTHDGISAYTRVGLTNNTIYNLRIEDTGNQVVVSLDGQQLFTTPTSFVSGAKISFSSRDFTEGQTGETRLYQLEVIPEPSSLSLLLAGGAVLMAGRRRKSD